MPKAIDSWRMIHYLDMKHLQKISPLIRGFLELPIQVLQECAFGNQTSFITIIAKMTRTGVTDD